MVIPDEDPLKPALHQGFVEGFFVVGLFKKLFLKLLQSFVDAISGILLSASDHLCNVLLELCLVGGLIAKERVDRLNYHILTDLYATAIDYDKNSATTRRFYATVQNKMHYAGKMTAAIAKIHAETEFEKYRVIQDRLFLSNFDKYMLELEENAKQ